MLMRAGACLALPIDEQDGLGWQLHHVQPVEYISSA